MPKRDRKPPARRCMARTHNGRQCRNGALDGSSRCWHHSYTVPGRPTKLTADVVERMVDAVRVGAYFDTAAQAAGVDRTTLYRWLRRGEEAVARAMEQVDDVDDLPDGGLYDLVPAADWLYLDFRHALKSAEAAGELELLEQVRQGANGWQAYMTVMERRWPAKWGRRDHVTVDDDREVAKPRVVVPDTEDTRAAIAATLAKAGALTPPEER